jgi:ribonuclease BN (tRNA processing enzyme)
MKIIFLGTNGWYDSDTGNTISVLLKTDEYNIVFDAGNGLYKLDRYLPENSDVYLFISHFHLDHIGGFHVLCKFASLKSLKIFGPEGMKEVVKTIISSPFTVPLEKLPYKTLIYELPEEKSEIPFRFETLPLLHSGLTLGFRVEIEGKVIAYCPDTGYCDNAVTLGRNADLLITECSLKPGQEIEGWPHLTPESAAKIAKDGGAKKLVLAHFSPTRFDTMGKRDEAAKDAGKIFNNTIAARDEMIIEL